LDDNWKTFSALKEISACLCYSFFESPTSLIRLFLKRYKWVKDMGLWKAANKLSKDGKIELARKTIVLKKFSQKSTTHAEGGTFLPLSVWVAKGFDGDMIKNNSTPENVQVHPVIGTTYRVELVSSGTKRSYGDAFEDVHTLGSGNGAGASASSGDVKQAQGNIQEAIEARLEEAQRLKCEQKTQEQTRKRLEQPLHKQLKSIEAIKMNIKASPHPNHWV
jgi:hypothetical protein